MPTDLARSARLAQSAAPRATRLFIFSAPSMMDLPFKMSLASRGSMPRSCHA